MKIPLWVSVVVVIATILHCKVGNDQKLGRVQTVWGSGKFNSQTWMDIWTADHFVLGMVWEKFISNIFKTEWAFIMLVVFACSFEMIENKSWLIGVWNQSNYSGDGIINSLCDILAAILGYAFAKHLSFHAGIGIIIGLLILIPIIRPLLFRTKSIRPWAGMKFLKIFQT